MAFIAATTEAHLRVVPAREVVRPLSVADEARLGVGDRAQVGDEAAQHRPVPRCRPAQRDELGGQRERDDERVTSCSLEVCPALDATPPAAPQARRASRSRRRRTTLVVRRPGAPSGADGWRAGANLNHCAQRTDQFPCGRMAARPSACAAGAAGRQTYGGCREPEGPKAKP